MSRISVTSAVTSSLVGASTLSRVFGGEHSAHYYFSEFFNADSGILAAMHILAALGNQEKPLSELMASYERYESSGEINTRLESQEEQQERTQAAPGGVRVLPH